MDVKTNSVPQEKIVWDAAIWWLTPDLQGLFQINGGRPVELVEYKIAGLKKLVFIGIVSVAGGSLVRFLCKGKTEWEAGYGR